jgi:hypothetical protein
MSEHGSLTGSVFEDGGERWVVLREGVDGETKQRVAFYEPEAARKAPGAPTLLQTPQK